MRKILILSAAVFIGNAIAERWVITTGAEGDTGFVPMANGFGLDDIARGVVIVGTAAVLDQAIGRFIPRRILPRAA